MKFKFNPNLDYQDEAVSSVVNLFEGQRSMQSVFTVTGQVTIDSNYGIGNRLELIEEDILENLRKVQLKNGLPQTENLNRNDFKFDVEMETGTGKTYVYLKTIFELNKQYGFSKFIIVVPSIAIKEGVYKSLKMTEDHFKGLYNNVIYDYFIYDSQELEKIRDFAIKSNIQIMIINIDSFLKSFKDDPKKENRANIIHRESEKLNGKPIDLIQETNPIVIIDEPQSAANTDKSKEAIASLNPLFTLQYSATFKEIHNLVYRLDAVDAYEKELVKQIEVASVESDYHNKAYIKLKSVDNKNSKITAKLELDIYKNGKNGHEIVPVHRGDDLYEITNREIYERYVVDEICCTEGNEYVKFTNNSYKLRKENVIGDIDDDRLKREQIKQTIKEHLNKELILNPQGIKVLSLFFIDKVANYRYYDNDGNPKKGKYAIFFEEEYKKLIKKPRYKTLLKETDVEISVESVYGGYFAQDKKKRVKDTKTNKNGESYTNETKKAYNLIMRDKEELLSFHTPLKFIFSHSALREGWDNPNVFQICTLNETKSSMKKRQEIGRGLRLCVNQNGERIKGFQTNTLTIMANESYEDFAKNLQNEIEKDEGIKFGIIQKHTFANISFKDKNGKFNPLGSKASEEIVNFFEEKGYITSKGKVTDNLKVALKNNALEIPKKYVSVKKEIIFSTKKIINKIPIRNKSDKRRIKLNKKVYLNSDFKEFWDKIKYKTTYSVDFSSEELIKACSHIMSEELDVKSPKLRYIKGNLDLKMSGIETTEKQRSTVYFDEEKPLLPDIVTFLKKETYLTRLTIVKILIESGTLNQFKKNPQEYMNETFKIISSQLKHMIVDGIKYTKLGDNEYYEQELFKNVELFGYLSKNMLESNCSVYDYVIYDSKNEADFAQRFENDENVELYTKLPRWFNIPTPLGNYNPDWAVLFEKDGERKLYFVLETKGDVSYKSLRQTEADKIKCGKKHFEALGHEVEFKAVDDFNSFIENI